MKKIEITFTQMIGDEVTTQAAAIASITSRRGLEAIYRAIRKGRAYPFFKSEISVTLVDTGEVIATGACDFNVFASAVNVTLVAERGYFFI